MNDQEPGPANDQECEAAQWLAQYVAEERPPPEVDIRVLAFLDRPAVGPSSRVWAGVGALAAALLLGLLARRSLAPGSRQDGSFVAMYLQNNATELRRVREVPPAGRPVAQPRDPPTLTPTPAEADDGSAVLYAGMQLIADGNYGVAMERLHPCEQTVGSDALLEDCESLLIEATCKSGDFVRGRQRIRAFTGQWPDSVHIRRLSGFCSQ